MKEIEGSYKDEQQRPQSPGDVNSIWELNPEQRLHAGGCDAVQWEKVMAEESDRRTAGAKSSCGIEGMRAGEHMRKWRLVLAKELGRFGDGKMRSLLRLLPSQ